MQRALPEVGPLGGLVLLTAALWVLHPELRAYHDHDVVRHAEERPPSPLLVALAEKTTREKGFPWAVAVASGEGRAFSQLDRRSKLSDKKAPLFTLLCFFDKVKLMLRFSLAH